MLLGPAGSGSNVMGIHSLGTAVLDFMPEHIVMLQVGTLQGTFPKSVWLYRTHPSGEERTFSRIGCLFLNITGKWYLIIKFPLEQQTVPNQSSSKGYRVNALCWSQAMAELKRTFQLSGSLTYRQQHLSSDSLWLSMATCRFLQNQEAAETWY